MTPEQIKQAEKDANDDAKLIALLLLTAMASKSSRELNRLVWKPETGKFYIKGRAVSVESIRKYLLRIESKLARKIAKITDELERKEISLADWQRQFESTITSAHVLAGALAVGGIASAVASSAIQERVASEIKFASDFTKEIRKNKAGSFARIRARAKSYVLSASITYSQIEQQVRGAIGIQTECARQLRNAEHCVPCLRIAKRGFMPIADMPPIGTLEEPRYPNGCGGFCRCYLIYR